MVTGSMYAWTNWDRDRGVLTRREREYLLGRADIEPKSQAERSIRQSIRQHLTHAILDFTILRMELESRDHNTVFGGKEGDGIRDIDTAIHDSIPDVVAFLARSKPYPRLFIDDLEEGLERVAFDQGASVNVSLDFEIEGRPIDDIRRQLEEEGAEQVELSEIKDLFQSGEFPEELSYNEIVAEKMGIEQSNEFEELVEEKRREAEREGGPGE